MEDGEVEFIPCVICDKNIDTTVIRACNNNYHLECFLCTGCKKPLSTRRYKQRDGLPYCSLTCNPEKERVCGKCKLPVDGSCMKALGTVFHAKCFTCKTCDAQIAVQTFFEIEDGAYCSICYKRQLDHAFEAAGNDIMLNN